MNEQQELALKLIDVMHQRGKAYSRANSVFRELMVEARAHTELCLVSIDEEIEHAVWKLIDSTLGMEGLCELFLFENDIADGQMTIEHEGAKYPLRDSEELRVYVEAVYRSGVPLPIVVFDAGPIHYELAAPSDGKEQ